MSIKEKNNMLVSFSVENYKSFKDKVSLNFMDAHDYKYNNHCIKNGLLNKVIIYGANASGKSNFGFALFDIVGLLTYNNTHPFQNDEQTFINADSKNKEAIFRYEFKNKKDKIVYLYKKETPRVITYEELYVNDKLIYSYDFTKASFIVSNMKDVYAENLNFEYFDNKLAILRYIAYNTSQPDKSPIKFVMNFVSHMLWFRSLQDNGYIGLMSGVDSLNQWISNNNLAKEFQRFLLELANIDLNLDILEIVQPITQKLLVEKHENKVFPFEQIASSGSKALELLFYWSKHFDEVTFLFMDEFDAFYHYDLAKNVIKYISDYDNMQVVFTTHNSNLASNELLRPDCYFTLENGKLTSFADSTEREIREGHNLEKMLRNGEFNG